jgi:hypothetical protein
MAVLGWQPDCGGWVAFTGGSRVGEAAATTVVGVPVIELSSAGLMGLTGNGSRGRMAGGFTVVRVIRRLSQVGHFFDGLAEDVEALDGVGVVHGLPEVSAEL